MKDKSTTLSYIAIGISIAALFVAIAAMPCGPKKSHFRGGDMRDDRRIEQRGEFRDERRMEHCDEFRDRDDNRRIRQDIQPRRPERGGERPEMPPRPEQAENN